MNRDYSLNYPHYLPMARQIRLCRAGQKFRYQGKVYVAEQILKSAMPNSPVTVVLKETNQ